MELYGRKSSDRCVCGLALARRCKDSSSWFVSVASLMRHASGGLHTTCSSYSARRQQHIRNHLRRRGKVSLYFVYMYVYRIIKRNYVRTHPSAWSALQHGWRPLHARSYADTHETPAQSHMLCVTNSHRCRAMKDKDSLAMF